MCDKCWTVREWDEKGNEVTTTCTPSKCGCGCHKTGG